MEQRARAVVMAGGKGERFWPVSTGAQPKQFIDLTGEGTLIQQTVRRLSLVFPLRDIFVVTSESYLALARSQLPSLPQANLIVEPVGRDTAPCIGLAAVWLERIDPDGMMLVVPADHYIPDIEVFCDQALTALSFARDHQCLVTLGVRPDRPETGYGYIEASEAPVADRFATVRRFVEKPSQDLAEEYLNTGRFLWNSGIFAWPTRVIRQEISRFLPELHATLQEFAKAEEQERFLALVRELFPAVPRISIDYGVMERSDRVWVTAAAFRWDDLGSWTALSRLQRPDENGNVTTGRVLTEDCSNLVVQAQRRLVATLGVKDLVVVETENAVLVCAKDRVQDVRRLTARIQHSDAQP